MVLALGYWDPDRLCLGESLKRTRPPGIVTINSAAIIMESALTSLIVKLIEYGSGFLIAAIFLTLYIMERKKNENLSKRLYDLGLESLKADFEHSKALSSLEKTLDTLAKAFSKGNLPND